jgi:hypothetical protein
MGVLDPPTCRVMTRRLLAMADYRSSTNWPLKTIGPVSTAVLLTNVFQVEVSVPVILLPLTVPVRAPATT